MNKSYLPTAVANHEALATVAMLKSAVKAGAVIRAYKDVGNMLKGFLDSGESFYAKYSAAGFIKANCDY